MSDRQPAILKHLETTRAALLDAVSSLSAEDWERPVASSEGAWTVRQAVAHLAAAEPGQLGTGRRMLTGEAKLPEGFSLSHWNQRQVEKRKERMPQQLLDDLRASRQELLAWIDGLSDADLGRSGQHARGDFITVEQLCYRIGEHEAEHTAEIRYALKKY
jgi:uncharacterized damage-inducible protein DinB